MKSLIYSGLARSAGFIPQAIATLLASRLIISHYGLSAFDTYALVVSVMTLLPLNNLGVGAAITQQIAAYGVEDSRTVRASLTAVRTLTLSALGLAVAATALGLAGLWPTLLGPASGSNSFVAIALILYGLSFVPGLAQNVLLGVDRNHLSILVQSFLAPVTLLGIGVLVIFGLDAGTVIVVPAAALVVINVFTTGLSARIASFPWGRILREAPRRLKYPGARIRAISGPMLIINLSFPIAFQSDRIILSHVSTTEAVASYSVVLQIFAPVTGLIVAAAMPLWPMFTKARGRGESGPQLSKVLLAFGGGTVVCSTALVFLADPVGNLIGGDKIQLGYFLPAMAALATGVQSIGYPLAMSLVDAAGLRFIARLALCAGPVNIGLSIVLAHSLGAPGPLIALFAVGLTMQLIPGLLYARGRQFTGRHRADAVRDDSVPVLLPAAPGSSG
jgi:O-antigen/teichoic acid export membrane protein